MSTIIAGHFQLQDEVERARHALIDAGFSRERVSGFYLSQPGQHDLTPIGGDNLHSPGAKESPIGVAEGAGVGAAVGMVAGAVTAPVTGPLGPVVGGLLGAHLGSLFSFSKYSRRSMGVHPLLHYSMDRENLQGKKKKIKDTNRKVRNKIGHEQARTRSVF